MKWEKKEVDLENSWGSQTGVGILRAPVLLGRSFGLPAVRWPVQAEHGRPTATAASVSCACQSAGSGPPHALKGGSHPTLTQQNKAPGS